MSISTVLLAYKEAENLKLLLPLIKKQLDKTGEKYEIIVIDTEKPLDNTEEVCKQFGAQYVNQKYPKFGGAFRTGIECAKYDKFLILDSDGSHNPKYIPAIYNAMKPDIDLVIGSRYTKGGKTNDNKTSIIMSHCLNFVFRVALGIKAKDISTDYRLYRTEQLKTVKLESENYDILEEVLLKLKLHNGKLRIAEVPIVFKKRLFGESKRALIPFIISYLKTLLRLIGIRLKHMLKK
ncbi:glycosyltransferase [Ruminococcus sp.]|uniref:glycosyltransferase n=1 Tax=Ruminococcus sp. TaxID=41978 RepID=UPI0025E74F42|nr:glycosyltransferase [Ruminococcus sp.]